MVDINSIQTQLKSFQEELNTITTNYINPLEETESRITNYETGIIELSQELKKFTKLSFLKTTDISKSKFIKLLDNLDLENIDDTKRTGKFRLNKIKKSLDTQLLNMQIIFNNLSSTKNNEETDVQNKIAELEQTYLNELYITAGNEETFGSLFDIKVKPVRIAKYYNLIVRRRFTTYDDKIRYAINHPFEELVDKKVIGIININRAYGEPTFTIKEIRIDVGTPVTSIE